MATKNKIALVLALVIVGYFGFNHIQTLRLRHVVTSYMDLLKTPISPIKRQIVIDTFVRVAEQQFDSYEAREFFATVVAIESHFSPDTGASTAGAVGLSQLMPQYVKTFTKQCGFPDINVEKDIKDIEINLMIGACLFNGLLTNLGNPARALVAYNAGTGSKAMVQLEKLATISNTETNTYLTKFLYLDGKKPSLFITVKSIAWR